MSAKLPNDVAKLLFDLAAPRLTSGDEYCYSCGTAGAEAERLIAKYLPKCVDGDGRIVRPKALRDKPIKRPPPMSSDERRVLAKFRRQLRRGASPDVIGKTFAEAAALPRKRKVAR